MGQADAASSRREQIVAEHADSQRPPQPECRGVSTIPTAAPAGPEKNLAEHAKTQRPAQSHCGIQDTMPDSDEIKELQMPIHGSDSLRSEAKDMPCAGFV